MPAHLAVNKAARRQDCGGQRGRKPEALPPKSHPQMGWGRTGGRGALPRGQERPPGGGGMAKPDKALEMEGGLLTGMYPPLQSNCPCLHPPDSIRQRPKEYIGA